MNQAQFNGQLKEYVKTELCSCIAKLDNKPISSLDFGIYPWYGYFEISILLEEELKQHGEDFKFNQGSWKFYNVNDFQSSISPAASKLGSWMENKFPKSRYWKYDRFFVIGSEIINSKEIQDILDEFNQSKDFYCSVYDPHDVKHRNYSTGYRRTWFKNTFLGWMIQEVNELNE